MLGNFLSDPRSVLTAAELACCKVWFVVMVERVVGGGSPNVNG